jgi:hypothetical protein
MPAACLAACRAPPTHLTRGGPCRRRCTCTRTSPRGPSAEPTWRWPPPQPHAARAQRPQARPGAPPRPVGRQRGVARTRWVRACVWRAGPCAATCGAALDTPDAHSGTPHLYAGVPVRQPPRRVAQHLQRRRLELLRHDDEVRRGARAAAGRVVRGRGVHNHLQVGHKLRAAGVVAAVDLRRQPVRGVLSVRASWPAGPARSASRPAGRACKRAGVHVCKRACTQQQVQRAPARGCA